MYYIVITEHNTREDLDIAYENGFKMIELALYWSKGDEILGFVNYCKILGVVMDKNRGTI